MWCLDQSDLHTELQQWFFIISHLLNVGYINLFPTLAWMGPAMWIFYFFKDVFIYLRERENMSGRGWGRGGSIWRRLCWAQHRAISHILEIMTWGETKSQPLNCVYHPRWHVSILLLLWFLPYLHGHLFLCPIASFPFSAFLWCPKTKRQEETDFWLLSIHP